MKAFSNKFQMIYDLTLFPVKQMISQLTINTQVLTPYLFFTVKFKIIDENL